MADNDSRAGVRYSTPEILDWVDARHQVLGGAVSRAFGAAAREGMPEIMVAPAEGRFIGLLAGLIGARKIVEVGTLAGFSAIHLARALPPDGHLWTLEFEPLHVRVARENLVAAGLAGQVTVVEGDAAETLGSLAGFGPFDLVFLDADKERYDVYGRWAADHLRPGGVLLADNAYFFGKLLDPESPGAAAVRRLHEEAPARFETTCLPTPDGLLMGVRR